MLLTSCKRNKQKCKFCKDLIRLLSLQHLTCYFTKILHCTKLRNSTQSGSAFVPTQPQNVTSSPYLKASSSKMIQVKRVGISMTVPNLHLSKCGELTRCLQKQLRILTSYRPPRSYSPPTKTVLLKAGHP
jgi:hypothetical protein